MHVAHDRRTSPLERMPVDFMVELSPEGDEEVFEADAFDLGRNGIGVRAAVLPDVGQRFRCRFELPGAVDRCEAQGEVVWAEDHGRFRGAFGIRFDDMDEQTRDLIEANVPTSAREPSFEGEAVRAVLLQLDGADSPLEADLVSSGDGFLLEQPLPFLSIGRGAEIALGDARARVVLERVRLRVEGGIPRLLLELGSGGQSSDATLEDSTLEELLTPTQKRVSMRETARIVPRTEAVEDVLEAKASAEDEEPILSVTARRAVEFLKPAIAAASHRVILLCDRVRAAAGPLRTEVITAIVAAWRTMITLLLSSSPKIAARLGGAPKRRTTQHTIAKPTPTAKSRRAAASAAKAKTIARFRLAALAITGMATAVGIGYALAAEEAEAPRVELPPESSAASWAATAATVIEPVTTPEAIEPLPAPEPSYQRPSVLPQMRGMEDAVSTSGPLPVPTHPRLPEATR